MRTNVLLSAAAFLVATLSLSAQAPSAPAAAAPRVASSGGTSPHETTSQTFDGRRDNRVIIVYGRPYSKAPRTGEIRKIWGALVPYGKVWRMGSDEATMLVTQQNLDLGGTVLPAGAYTLDMQPEADGSAKLIVGKRLGQWGIPYDGSKEVARIDMKRSDAEKPADQFTITLVRNPAGGGTLNATWENTTYSVAFTFPKT
ncbi:MAG TPA: DUF2911 domain-containing protein [Opitutaceae bacterium]|nr:DUF2911 domain-containing protein [Opitutaceae bacterium]